MTRPRQIAKGWSEFKPILRPGSLASAGGGIEFLLEDRVTSIRIQPQLVDVLVLCTGELSVREIIEKMYLKYNTVNFRSIVDLIIELQRSGFLSNASGIDLEDKKSLLLKFFPGSLVRMWQQSLEIRILLKDQNLKLAYLTSMSILIVTLMSLGTGPFNILQVSKMAIGANPFLLLCCFILATNFIGLLHTLTHLAFFGRILSFKFSVGILGFHFGPEEISFGLIRERLFRILYHASYIATPLAVLGALTHLEPLLAQSLSAILFRIDLSDIFKPPWHRAHEQAIEGSFFN